MANQPMPREDVIREIKNLVDNIKEGEPRSVYVLVATHNRVDDGTYEVGTLDLLTINGNVKTAKIAFANALTRL